MGRIVNIKYRCCGLNFDAAIDCDWCLHSYGLSEESETLYMFQRINGFNIKGYKNTEAEKRQLNCIVLIDEIGIFA